MSLIEPFILGGLTSYILLPLATYALGFDPSLSWQYVALFGLAPILLALPACIPITVIFEALFGGPNRKDQLGFALMTATVSVGTFLIVSYLVHAPTTNFQTFALAVSSPFIGGIGIALTAGAAASLAYGIWTLYSLINGTKPSKV